MFPSNGCVNGKFSGFVPAQLFFFSSRRRHTRCLSDWSSDVCSSDLRTPAQVVRVVEGVADFMPRDAETGDLVGALRSEERRVGKECRSRRAEYYSSINKLYSTELVLFTEL